MASQLNVPKPEVQAKVKPMEETSMKILAQTGNIELGEQVLRGGVGMIMLETVLLTPALTPALIAGLAIAALYLVFTAIIGRDPVYALAQGSRQHREAMKASVTPYPARGEKSVSRGQLKAA
jgi:hypothetical protein